MFTPDIHSIQTLALAEAITQCRDFVSLCTSDGTPTLAALAQGRPFCWIGSRPKLDESMLNGQDYMQPARWVRHVGESSMMNPAEDEARSVLDDSTEYRPHCEAMANDTARRDTPLDGLSMMAFGGNGY
jgi:hypothetical protein